MARIAATPANPLKPRTAKAPNPGTFTDAMLGGMRSDRHAAVLVTTKRRKLSGSRVATPMPMAPPQSCTTSVMSRSPSASTTRATFPTCPASR